MAKSLSRYIRVPEKVVLVLKILIMQTGFVYRLQKSLFLLPIHHEVIILQSIHKAIGQ